MINSEFHLEPADPYLEEENTLWQLRCSHDSSAAWEGMKSGQGPSHSTPSPEGSPGEGGGWGREVFTWMRGGPLRGGQHSLQSLV